MRSLTYLYHVVGGSRSTVASQSTTVTAGGTLWVGFRANSTGLGWPFGTLTGGYPSGRVGVVTSVSGAITYFSSFTCYGGAPRADVGTRWETDRGTIGSDSRLTFDTYPAPTAVLLKNLRLEKFQATFAVRMPNSSDDVGQLRFLFDVKEDPEKCDWVTIIHGKSGSWCQVAGVVAGTGRMTSFTSDDSGGDPGSTVLAYDDVVWTRVQSDGSQIKVWFIIRAAAGATPTDSDWAAIVGSPALTTSTGLSFGGGRFGFASAAGGGAASVDDLTIKSWNTSTSAFDTVECVEPFTLDGSGYVADTCAYDSNGNLTYDTLQSYTYDAWNRQMTVAHAYRDSGGTLHSGQTSTTCAYDSAGRRIIKAVANTGSWDCTYHYYYFGEHIIEERNGSDQSIKDHVWGLTYVDEAIQTRINTTPTSTATWSNYYPLQDANFNVLGVVDSSANLTERYEHGAYGSRQVFASAGSNDPGCYAAYDASVKVITSGSVTQPYGLCEIGHQGLQHDEQSNLVYNRARYLHPILGRFCQNDPLGYVDGMNDLAYVLQNPIILIDPSGEEFLLGTAEEWTTGETTMGRTGVGRGGVINDASESGWSRPQWNYAPPRPPTLTPTPPPTPTPPLPTPTPAPKLTPIIPPPSGLVPIPTVNPQPQQTQQGNDSHRGGPPGGNQAGPGCPDPCDDPPPLPNGAIEKNHVYPQYLSGGDIGPTVPLAMTSHRGPGASFHNDVNAWMERYTDNQGHTMRSGGKNSGPTIRQNFSPEERINAMSDFYSGPCGKKWARERDAFFDWLSRYQDAARQAQQMY